MIDVVKTQCDQCLFSKNRIVSASRKRDILQGCIKNDTHFICHKTEKAVCRGFYDGPFKESGVGQLLRIASRINAVNITDDSAPRE